MTGHTCDVSTKHEDERVEGRTFQEAGRTDSTFMEARKNTVCLGGRKQFSHQEHIMSWDGD